MRTAKCNTITTARGETLAIGELYPMPAHDHCLIEGVRFTQEGYGPINCLVWHSQQYSEPIYLISNLEWAKDIMGYYTRRFSIETLFGDIKSRGFNLHKVRLDDPERLKVLLMVICIAFLLVCGLATFQDKLQRRLAMFLRKDRVHAYSFFQIGLRAFRFFINQHLRIFPQYVNNYQQFICVRQ